MPPGGRTRGGPGPTAGRRPPITRRPRLLQVVAATLVLLSVEGFLVRPSLPTAAAWPRLPVSVAAAATTTAAAAAAAPAPSPSLEPTPEQLKALQAEEEGERQQRLGYQRALERQRHVLVELEGAGADLLGPLTDILVEGGATEVSYATTTRALGGASLRLGVTVPSEREEEEEWPVDVEGLVRLAVEATFPPPDSSSSSVRWSIEEAPTPCGIDWMRAAAEPGFDPVLSGKFHVVPVQRSGLPLPPSAQHELRILAGEGWGTGQHPTTRLCLDFLSREGVICGGERIVDYGVGSGILSIAAVQLGAREAVGVDIEVDALVSARVNTQLNNVEDEVDLMHARELVPGEFVPGDIVLANILVGTLLRMANTIIGAVRPGGWLVLCGLRPEQLETIQQAYASYIDFDDSLQAMEEVELAQASWGTGAGFWVRLVGRKKSVRGESWIEALSESAVS